MTRYSIQGATPDQIRSAGGITIKKMRHIPVAFVELSNAQADRLRAEGAIVERPAKTKPITLSGGVETPHPVEASPVYQPQEMVSAIGLENLRSMTVPPLYGDDFNVAVMGTGIRSDHELLNGRVIYEKSYISGETPADGFDHDTGVASLLLAVAPRCGILNMKVLANSGEGTEEAVVEAIDDCLTLWETTPEKAPVVINLSLGSEDTENASSPMRVACRAAVESGIWVIAAAGNSGPGSGTITSPACERYVGAVGSCSLDPFVVSEFSSRGPTSEGHIKPDMVFFGEDLIMASSAGPTATVGKSGTSFSAPFASGIALLYLQAMIGFGGVSFPEPKPPEVHEPSTEPSSFQDMIDTHLPNITVKPQGVSATKDNNYGDGVVLGDLIAQQFAPSGIGGIDLSSIMGLMVTMMMMGMMMKMMTGSTTS